MKAAALDAEKLHGLLFRDPVDIKALQDLFDKLNRQPFMNSSLHPKAIIEQGETQVDRDLYLVEADIF